MIKSVKLQQLEENYKASESEMSFREYVEPESANDPTFFSWLFDTELDEDFDTSLSDEQREEFKEFINEL